MSVIKEPAYLQYIVWGDDILKPFAENIRSIHEAKVRDKFGIYWNISCLALTNKQKSVILEKSNEELREGSRIAKLFSIALLFH
jgi:hypothetical protein